MIKKLFPVKESIFTGLSWVALAIADIVLAVVMWQQSGAPYNGVYYSVVLTAMVSSAAVFYYLRRPLMILPNLGVNSFLCYELVINHGNSWQAAMALLVLTGLLVIIMERIGWLERFARCLPGYLYWCVPAGLGAMLIYRGLVESRLVISSPFNMTAMGNLADPLVLLTLLALIIVIVLVANDKSCALLAGILLAAIVSLVKGYIILPAGFFSIPEGLEEMVFQMEFLQACSLWGDGVALFIVMLIEGIAMESAMKNIMADSNNEIDGGAAMANGVAGVIGGLLGGGASSVSPLALIVPNSSADVRKCFSVFLAGMMAVLFSGPLLLALAEQPYVTSASLIGAGLMIFKNLKFSSNSDKISYLAGCFSVGLILLWGSITAGICFGLCLYSIMLFATGQASRQALWIHIPGIALIIYILINI